MAYINATMDKDVMQSDRLDKKKVNIDEINRFFKVAYATVHEAHINMLSFGPVMFSDNIISEGVHLENDQGIVIATGETIQNLAYRMENRPGVNSAFTAYMDLCAQHSEEDEELQEMTFLNVLENYMYDKKTKTFRKAMKKLNRIAELYEVPIRYTELYSLRAIVLRKKCIKSYEDARTIDGVVFETYSEAAQAMGLFESDVIWRGALDQRRHQPISSFAFLFAQILLQANIASPMSLWNDYCQYMMPPPNKTADPETDLVRRRLEALNLLRYYLTQMGSSLNEHDLPELPANFEPYVPENAHSSDPSHLPDVNTLHPEQKAAFDKIWAEVENKDNKSGVKLMSLVGQGCSGKTVTINAMIKECYKNNLTVPTTATTGVAANLLHGGKTLHSQFNIPRNVDSETTPNMEYSSKRAETIRMCRLLIIDEASQLHVDVLKYVLKVLDEVRDGNRPQIVILMCGDWRQILPVVKTSKAAYLYSLLGAEDRLPPIEYLHLTKNYRAAEDEIEYMKFLLETGEGKNFSDEKNGLIDVPEGLKITNNIKEVVDFVFSEEVLKDPDQCAGSAVLSPTNAQVDQLNRDTLKKLPGKSKTYEAIDEVVDYDLLDCHAGEANLENIATKTPTGFPHHKLELKVGSIVILIRNISIPDGLCNGTRLIVEQLDDHVITCRVLETSKSSNGPRVIGKSFDFPRYRFMYEPERGASTPYLRYSRLQFPFKLGYAMTINKAQGQTLNRVGVVLSSNVFSHGQLYVALSRARSILNIIIFNPNEDSNGKLYNVVDKSVQEFFKRK